MWLQATPCKHTQGNAQSCRQWHSSIGEKGLHCFLATTTLHTDTDSVVAQAMGPSQRKRDPATLSDPATLAGHKRHEKILDRRAP
jgi:hypothetical protein